MRGFIKALPGVVLSAWLLISLLWKGGRWLLGFLGNIDFVVKRIQDPGWVRTVINTLENNTIYQIIFFVLGIVWLSYVFWSPISKKMGKSIKPILSNAKSSVVPSENPLKIEFQTSNFRVREEGLAPLGLTEGNRKTFWIEIVNSDPNNDVQNVVVEIKKVVRLKETGEENPNALSPIQAGSHRLKFNYSGAYEIDFPPKRQELVDIVSATDAFTGSEQFRIEGDETEYFSPHNTHKITVEITAKNVPAVTKAFFVHIDPNGDFKMVAC